MTDKLLFTPGPLTTSQTVKAAMQRDLGSRDAAFINIVRGIRSALVKVAGGTEPDYVAVPMQGSGTFGVESVIGSVIPKDGKLLTVENGAYGARMGAIASTLGISLEVVSFPEHEPAQPEAIAAALERDASITHVALVHCETTTGLVNPMEAIGRVVRGHGRGYIVDAISSLGGIPLSAPTAMVDYLISSSNKCIEGVPGFAFVIARREALESSRGRARSFTLDLVSQLDGLEKNGQFRFTPPTHALLAFEQALTELAVEGGVTGRAARYNANHETLMAGMRRMGFRPFLAPEHQSHIITAFHDPAHPRYRFEEFYDRLSQRGFVIYPGKVNKANCFRIGTIGRIDRMDVESLLRGIAAVLGEMGVPLPI